MAHLILGVVQVIRVKLDENCSDRSRRIVGVDVLSHYVVVWTSVMTSPKSFQLDFWLMVVALMDLAPLVYAIAKTGLFLLTP